MTLRRFVIALALLSGCATFGTAHGPPRVDRCAAQPEAKRSACARTFAEAEAFAEKLFTDDQICIDGEHALRNTDGCRIRAFVESTAPNAVKLEIRDAPPDSTYKIDGDYWFDHKALADLECRAQGYSLPEDRPIR